MPSMQSPLPLILSVFLLLLAGQTTAHPTKQTRSDAEISSSIPLDLLRRDLQTRSLPEFFTTPTIIALSAGGFSFLLLMTLLCVCCHRKRKQGRKLLAAYESPDRTPYEAIQLQKKKSASTTSLSTTTAASPSTTEKLDVVRKDELQVHVSTVELPAQGYSPRTSSLGGRGGQLGVSVPGRVLVRGNGGREKEVGMISPPASPFAPRPASPFLPYSPTTTTTPPISPYGPPSPRAVAGPYGPGGGGVIGGAL
ncbi:hypothetical protein L873DRAFT_919737 [Choiromyces venosus 120613-1]|uniref:Uncharacterized protein n=1 Tax=Choiromyces venosus 120613-1 TaxID=1336337 RepID=A0A3N4JT79_9PEZI|nr:hypothetical protein L873DRAFT_919737 [Choiromyces venosus 120613-1]